jgi:Na+-translocating ferredoxin:NAD+ oxidoreductase RnfE subunit
MNENMAKSLFRTAPGILLGSGLIAPLCSNLPLTGHLVLGGIAALSLLFMMLVIAIFGERIPHNGRTAFAVLLTGGTVSIAAIAIAPFFRGNRLPVETLAPLLLVAALLSLCTEAYAVKKRIQPVLFDTVGIGVSFIALLCLCGGIRDLAANHFIGKKPIIPGMEPVAYFSTPSGIFLLVALAVAVLAFISKKKNGTNP